MRPARPACASGELASLTLADAAALEKVSGVEAVSPERGGSVTLQVGNLDYRTQIKGVGPIIRRCAIGRWRRMFFSKADVDGYAPVIVLGSTVADSLFPDGRSPLGRYVLVKNVPFEVVGVLSSKGATPFGSDRTILC